MIIANKYKNYEKTFTYIIFFISVPLICIFPKINILPLPGFWQGIQLFDLLILLFVLYFIFNLKFFKFKYGEQFTNLFIFFPYLIFTSIIGLFISEQNLENVHGVTQFNNTIIITIRFIEYLFFVILALNYFNSKNNLKYFFEIYILINFIIAFLQEYNLIGFVNSRGFFSSGDFRIGGRPMGLTGGPWELGASTSIAFFGLYFLNNKKINLKIILYLFITLTCLIFAETKSNIIGFIISLLFLNLKIRYITVIFFVLYSIFSLYFSGLTLITYLIFIITTFLIYYNYKKYHLVVIYFILIIISSSVINYFQNHNFLQRLLNLDFLYLLKLMYNFFIYQNFPKVTETPDLNLYYSLIVRLSWWNSLLTEFKSSWVNMIFGMGNQKIYYESFIFRCVFAFGFLGSLIIIYLSRKLPIFFIVFTIFAGITFDLYFASKVFFLTILFFIAYNNYYLINK